MRSITLKLALGFLIICVLEAILVAVFVRQVTQWEFNRYVQNRVRNDIVDDVIDFYEREASWSGVAKYFDPNDSSRDRRRRNFRRWRRYAGQFALIDSTGQVMIASGPFKVGGTVSTDQLTEGTPLRIDNRFIGTLIHTEKNPPLNNSEQRYLDRTYKALLYALISALAIALLWSFFLASKYTRPLRELIAAARAIAQGQIKQHLAISSKDELGTLTTAFNDMSDALDKANALRQQMTVDIAHELRTPLTSLLGYLESMSTGNLQPNQDRLQRMYDEAKHLERLVDDLRTLSLVDAGELQLTPQWVSIETMLSQIEVAFELQMAQKNISFEVQSPTSAPPCWLDPFRMDQVLDNLISNALRHTPEGGRIRLSAQIHDAEVHLVISDTGPGIPKDALPLIFERFYRVETARQTQEGSTGIGLAIVRSFVEAQGGRVSVASELAQGTTFTVVLPLDGSNDGNHA
jgi:signal transduction histidine kinase